MPSSAVDRVDDRVGERRDEAIDLVPPALRTWWTATRSRLNRADVGALAVALGQVPFLLWVLVPGSLYLDDLRGQTYAAGRSWWPFVVQSNGTHFSPVARTIDWVTVKVGPLADWPAVTVTVLIRVALVLVVWRLLRELFGPRTALLIPLGLVAITPALLPTTAWYRQAMSSLLVVIALSVAAQQHLRHVRTGSTGNLVGAAVAVAAGLLTFEKATLIAPWLVVLTAAAVPAQAGVRERLRRVWRARVSFVVYAALTAAHLLIYVTGPFDKGAAGDLQAAEVVKMMGRQLSEGLVPGLLGGPWHWTETSPYYSIPSPPAFLVVLGLVLTGLAAVWSFRRNPRRTVCAFLLFAAYYLPAAGMVAAGRLTTFGNVVALDYRLWPDVTIVAILCGCLATMRVRGETSERPSPPGLGRSGRGLAVAAATVVAVGSVASTVGFSDRWHDNPTGGYLHTLQGQLDAAPSQPVRVAPVALPSSILPFWVDPDYSVEDLLAPAGTQAIFHNTDGPVLVPGDDGRLEPLRLRTLATAAPGPNGFCGYSVAPGRSRQISLPAASPYYADEMVQVGVLASRATALTVSVVDNSSRRRVLTRSTLTTGAGPHRVLARVPYDTRVSAIRVRATDPLATICVVLAALVVPQERS